MLSVRCLAVPLPSRLEKIHYRAYPSKGDGCEELIFQFSGKTKKVRLQWDPPSSPASERRLRRPIATQVTRQPIKRRTRCELQRHGSLGTPH